MEMELLRPEPATGFHLADKNIPAKNPDVGRSLPVQVCGANCSTEIVPEEEMEEESERVFVAVGKSPEKVSSLLEWTFRQFGDRELTLIHVHRPSDRIPTPLGNLPASQANEVLLSAYRKKEKEQMLKLLDSYLHICDKAKVQANVIVIEASSTENGIMDLVAKHAIRKLVMEASGDSFMKSFISPGRAQHAAKKVPLYCEISFVSKGKHVFTRHAVQGSGLLPQSERLRSKSFPNRERSAAAQAKYQRSISSIIPNNSLRAENSVDDLIPVKALKNVQKRISPYHLQSYDTNGTSCPSRASTNTHPSWKLFPNYDDDNSPLATSMIKDLGAFPDMHANPEVNKFESEAMIGVDCCDTLTTVEPEANSRVKDVAEMSEQEKKLREEAECKLRAVRFEKESLLKQHEELVRKLQKAAAEIAFLERQVSDSTQLRDEAAEQLKVIKTSLAVLEHEKSCIHKQGGIINYSKGWKDPYVSDRLDSELRKFTLYTMLDLQTATCNFSESFKLGEGGHGCVYKGEISGRTVAVKKFHLMDMHSVSEFQQEVNVLSSLRHPNLVTLLGACPEDLCLVYEYLPNGSLHKHLTKSSNTQPLGWILRTRICAQIASALLFLHSSKPVKIIHGDLKPENILLSCDFTCKIGDFGISRLLQEQNPDSRMFHGDIEHEGSFAYADPEFQRTGVLTPASDVYAFGVLVLQLVTGRPPFGLAKDIRRAMSSGHLEDVVDISAGKWPSYVVRKLVDLGIQCCEANRRERLELTPEVVWQLEQLTTSEEQKVPASFICPIYKVT